CVLFFFSSRRRHTRFSRDWSSDVCSSDLFSTPGTAPRVGVRVGDSVVDLAMALGDDVFAQPTLNAFMAQGYRRWVEVRERISERSEERRVGEEWRERWGPGQVGRKSRRRE